MRDPLRGHAALRRGRVSIPNAEYFLTICTANRQGGLTDPLVAAAMLAEMRSMDADATWHLRCAVVMPDHVHLLMILGTRLSLGKAVARLKSKTTASLHLLQSAMNWERDFFDHHLRPDDDRIGTFLYICLNPYRAGLYPRVERWPWYYCRGEDWVWFKDYLDEDRPLPEWLQ